MPSQMTGGDCKTLWIGDIQVRGGAGQNSPQTRLEGKISSSGIPNTPPHYLWQPNWDETYVNALFATAGEYH